MRGALAAVVVLVLGEAVADGVVEDMALREARRGVRGENSRGGATRTVKGGWSATRVVTRGRWQRYCNHIQKSAVGV